ncbi:MAG: NAD-dependent epimerase/dehydratase family protein [Saprospirales bacterium]|nr:NAD-dependent epimerase/dehydratase family protein [Saprospirales bacterium]
MGYILIAGGTGLIGTRLCELLQEKGYETALLSRQKAGGKTKTFVWDPERGTIDPEALRNASAVINLAGAGIADTWWTPARKRVLIQSRTQPTALLGKMLQSTPNQVETYISASGIGIYGDTGDTLLDENAPSGNDFLAECTRIWETAFGEVEQLPLRTAAIRIGIVLSPEGGAMAKILLPFRFRIGAYFRKGKAMVFLDPYRRPLPPVYPCPRKSGDPWEIQRRSASTRHQQRVYKNDRKSVGRPAPHRLRALFFA